ncbi:MAG: head decoration protein [Spirochaetaceae bacterium]|nr:head decoration protein [Spirochaetaceae bacterium]
MDAVIGNLEYGRKQVLHGDHHVVITKEVKAAQGEHNPGTVFAVDDSGDLVPLDPAAYGTTQTVKCVLLEQTDTASVDAAPMCVHGPVKKSVLVDKDGTAVIDAVIADLEALTIYAV